MLRMGMIGGGLGAFIGPVHRRAAELDGNIRLVAGAFSRSADTSRASGLAYGIAPERTYPDYRTMLAEEARRPDGIQFVSIVTPNDMHFAIARDAITAGIGVVSDKPATTTLAQAIELRQVIRDNSGAYALTYTYTGYPMLREARALVADGALGALRKVVVEYYQGWLATPGERTGNKQAEWRTDPDRAGIGGCVGDIGVHAFNLAEFVTSSRVQELNADLSKVVPGRTLDDDCTILVRFANNVPGLIAASQIATGERNGLRLRVYGEKGGLDWCHERPDLLVLNRADGVTECRHAGSDSLGPSARAATRLPAGHPEGFFEALANIYGDFAQMLSSKQERGDGLLQTIDEGVRSMAFVETAVESSANRRWMGLRDV